MHWLKTSRIIYLLWLILFLYLFSCIDVNAYTYILWVSRKYYTGSNHYIVGTGSIWWYEKEFFTGLGYCTWYYYLNHNRDLFTDNDVSLARQVLKYDSSNVQLSWDYINLKLTGWSTSWDTNNLYGPLTDSWFSLFRFNILKTSWAPVIPLTYTLWRFRLVNNQVISGTNISLYYLNPSSLDASTYINHTNSTFDTNADKSYSVSIKYYAQPCIPDTPISASNTTKINGNADGSYTLARVSAFNFMSNWGSNSNAWRPITLGYTNFADLSNFVPWSFNVGSFNRHISFDSGVYLAWIKEPDKNSQPNESFDQRYYYDAWSAKYSWFDLVDSNFISSPADTTNQRWINPNTIIVYVYFTGVDRTNYSDSGTPCMITITWDTNLWLSWLWYSWNRNQLWYSINISSGTIRTLAKQQCSFAGIATWNIELKRETVANIKRDAWDYSNSMIISQDNNTETYSSPNQITQTTWYSFNSYISNPTLYMSTDSTALVNWSTVYNIPVTNQNLRFTGTDDWAGINSGAFLIVVSGYESSATKSNSRRTSWIPDHSYVFSGDDISKFSFNLHNERYDYTWLVNFVSNLQATTGMYFTVYFKVTDFVGNITTQNYIFKTPTWPNPPKWTTWSIQNQTKDPIDQINFIDSIIQDTTADGWWSYNYTTYYPSSSGLVSKFSYISGEDYLDSNVDIVLTWLNGNVWPTVVTLTWLMFYYNGANSYITWTPYVSSGWQTMLDYVATTFTFRILITNVYGITWIITYNITISPSCTESAWCTDPVYVFRWTTLSEAMAQRIAAIASGTTYLNANHRYPHWFAEIKQTGPSFYFTGDSSAKILYCAATGNDLLINYGWYSGPTSSSANTPLSTSFTGSDLTISGGTIRLFGVFTASVTANYTTVLDNWKQKMTIYVNRPLTGRSFYSICELTGWSIDDFGCSTVANHNWTWDVNWTKLTNTDAFTMTAWIEWWRLTWNWDGYVTGWSINNGNRLDFWSTGTTYDGWWYIKYTKTLSGDIQQNINTSWDVSFSVENRKWTSDTLAYEIYWIDNTAPEVTWVLTNILPNQSVTLVLSGFNTWQISNSQVSNLIWDDEYIVTSFSGNTAPQLFENGYGSTIHTWSWYINGGGSMYSLTHAMTFASNRTGTICTIDRAGNQSCNYVEVLWIWNLTDLVITIRPAFRPDPSTNNTWYSIVNWDFWFRVASGSQWIQNYNSVKNTSNPKITTNKNGTWTVSITAPATGSLYLVAFKWSGTLSAGFTGVWSNSITELNFFSWDYASNFSSDFVYKFNNSGTMEYYLKVWDLISDTTWSYDFVKDADFAEINNNLTIWTNQIPYYRYDFDLNGIISSMEQSMILQARDSHWFIWRLNYNNIIPMTGFVNF